MMEEDGMTFGRKGSGIFHPCDKQTALISPCHPVTILIHGYAANAPFRAVLGGIGLVARHREISS